MLASAIAVVGLALAQDGRPASAAGPTQIVVSYSDSFPSAESLIVLNIDGDPVTLYVWAKDVKSDYGVAAFEVSFDYNSQLMSVTSLDPVTIWLASTGRGGYPPNYYDVWCAVPLIVPNVDTGDGYADVGCITGDRPPPAGHYGPKCDNGHCSGIIATFTLQPGSEGTPSSPLDFGSPVHTRTKLVDTGLGIPPYEEPEEIPAEVISPNVFIVTCGDFDGDGEITLFGDIFAVGWRFGMTPDHPDWDPMYDLDGDGVISLFGDVMGTAMQFGISCTIEP